MKSAGPDPAAFEAEPHPADRESDLCAWLAEQARLLRMREFAALDIETLAEEIDGIGRGKRREIKTRLEMLLRHLLLWQYRPEGRGDAWREAIRDHRRAISAIIEESPSLRDQPRDALETEYQIARHHAAALTGLPLDRFPETCPYAIEDIQHENFLPLSKAGRP